MTNKENLQVKFMDIIAYPESCNIVEALEKLTKSYVTEKYAYILHDKDTNEDGKLKKPHYHIFVAFAQRVRVGAIAKIFNTAPNNINGVKQYQSLLRYYCHKDNPEKYQYSKEDLCVRNINLSEIDNEIDARDTEVKSMLTLIDKIYLPDTDLLNLITFALENDLYFVLRDNYLVLRDLYKEKKVKNLFDNSH